MTAETVAPCNWRPIQSASASRMQEKDRLTDDRLPVAIPFVRTDLIANGRCIATSTFNASAKAARTVSKLLVDAKSCMLRMCAHDWIDLCSSSSPGGSLGVLALCTTPNVPTPNSPVI